MHGWIILDKPVGPGSTQAVTAVKRALRAGSYPKLKVGHGGTLDPLASGVLPVAIGEATKLAGRMLDASKVYDFTIAFGVETDTLDAEGTAVATSNVRPSWAEIEAVLPRFTGEIEQVPPMHSALKHQGRPLYEYARAGIDIERPPRRVRISALEMVSCDLPHVVLDVRCSAGTYVRTLAQDIGAALGCGAHLTALTRTAAGGFTLAQAHGMAELEALDAVHRHALLLPADSLVAHLPAAQLEDADAAALRQGRTVAHVLPADGLTRVYAGAAFIGLASASAGSLTPRRLVAGP